MSTNLSRLKKQFLTLLKEDEEFRYAVAGLIGIEEILKRLDRHTEELAKLRDDMNKAFEKHHEEIAKLWEEAKTLREGQEKLWEEVRSLREGQNKLWEGQNKLWEEVRLLREGQEKLWEGQNKLWEEVRSLREGQNKLWEEVRLLREGQNKLWEEVKSLREGQNKLWEEVKSLREGQNKLWDETRRLRNYMIAGFGELRTALGVTYEMHAAAYVEAMLDELGHTGARVERKYIVLNGEVLDIDIFCERPLIIGEVTISIKDVESATREVEKLYERVNAVKTKYGKTPEMIILSVGSTTEDVANYLKETSKKRGFRLILGREIEEALSPA